MPAFHRASCTALSAFRIKIRLATRQTVCLVRSDNLVARETQLCLETTGLKATNNFPARQPYGQRRTRRVVLHLLVIVVAPFGDAPSPFHRLPYFVLRKLSPSSHIKSSKVCALSPKVLPFISRNIIPHCIDQSSR